MAKSVDIDQGWCAASPTSEPLMADTTASARTYEQGREQKNRGPLERRRKRNTVRRQETLPFFATRGQRPPTALGPAQSALRCTCALEKETTKDPGFARPGRPGGAPRSTQGPAEESRGAAPPFDEREGKASAVPRRCSSEKHRARHPTSNAHKTKKESGGLPMQVRTPCTSAIPRQAQGHLAVYFSDAHKTAPKIEVQLRREPLHRGDTPSSSIGCPSGLQECGQVWCAFGHRRASLTNSGQILRPPSLR